MSCAVRNRVGRQLRGYVQVTAPCTKSHPAPNCTKLHHAPNFTRGFNMLSGWRWDLAMLKVTGKGKDM